MNTAMRNQIATLAAYGLAIIFILLPFHGFFTAWAASQFGHFDLIRIWKELLIVILGIGAAWLVYKDKQLRKTLKHNPLIYLIIIYAGLEIGLGLIAYGLGKVNRNALLYGWIADLRFLAFFLVALVTAAKVPIKQYWRVLLLLPAAIVVAFGLLQHFILPVDFLRHFGYGAKTLEPYQTVDLKTAYIRLQSTLRGPNPLGAYLILIITASSGLMLRHRKHRTILAAFLATALAVLFFSYSRSAWIGTAIGVGLVTWLALPSAKLRKLLVVFGASLILIFGVGILALRHNDRVENTFFHTDEHSKSLTSSNHDRTAALETGLRDIVHDPWGRGPGTAGPASLRNNHPARIAENYYLQIGQELGIVGLTIFLAINLYVAYYLWQQRQDTLASALLASLVGITFVNLLSHAWADDTLALLWWGFAGVALATRRPAK